MSTSGAGAADAQWAPEPDDSVSDLDLDAAGNLYVAGYFENIGGQPQRHLARLSAESGTVDVAWAPNPDGGVLSIAFDRPERVYVGGAFSEIGGEARRFIAALSSVAVSLTANADPAPYNGLVLTARVGEGEVPATGTVTFTLNGNPIAGCVDLTLDANGEATCSPTDLEPGSYSFALTFTGSGAYSGVASTTPGSSTNVVVSAVPLLAPWGIVALGMLLVMLGGGRLQQRVVRVQG